jgi:prevent-host-death family protein
MDLESTVKPISYLKANAAAILHYINDTHQPMIITQNGEARAVLQDPESYSQMREAFGLLKLMAQGENDIRDGNLSSQEDVLNRFKRRLGR